MADSWANNGREALIIFAREPAAGDVKTRLQPPLSADEAAELYGAFVDDSMQRYSESGADPWLFIAGSGPEPWAARYPDLSVRNQDGRDLGSRMSNAFETVFSQGYHRAVIVGTDHPTLPVSYIRRAFQELLETPGMVIGPAHDGGYYLLGMNELRGELFAGMTYGHERVFDQTLRRAAAHKLSVTILPYWYDVDDEASLRMLIRELARDNRGLRRTRAVLRRLSDAHPELF